MQFSVGLFRKVPGFNIIKQLLYDENDLLIYGVLTNECDGTLQVKIGALDLQYGSAVEKDFISILSYSLFYKLSVYQVKREDVRDLVCLTRPLPPGAL